MSIKHVSDGRLKITAATFAELEHEVHKHEAEGLVADMSPWIEGAGMWNFGGGKETVWSIVMKEAKAVPDEVAK